MSELINKQNGGFIHNRLLGTASALALVAYLTSSTAALSENGDRPSVWIELGGQMEMLQGTSSSFTAPFMELNPVPGPYKEDSLIDTQHSSNHAFGLDGKIIFQPDSSDWRFSAGIRYGRSGTRRHVHHQSDGPTFTTNLYSDGPRIKYPVNQPFADTRLQSNESHFVLDFQAGKDVGLGILGSDSTMNMNVGVRFAQFSSKTSVDIYARPTVGVNNIPIFYGLFTYPAVHFYQYTMHAHASRSFMGVGPSLSWNASTALFGNSDHAELTLDWGVNGALLFGRSKAKTDHATQSYYLTGQHYPQAYVQPHPPRSINNPARSRSVVVPNLGGFAGLSVKYPNAKVSLGYRADFFFRAVDAGVDTRRTKNLGFHGPYASISIGLGG